MVIIGDINQQDGEIFFGLADGFLVEMTRVNLVL